MADHIRVLAVDDSSMVRSIMTLLFTAAGCEIVTASGVREGLRVLRHFVPDVILTDYNMPGLNGHAFVSLVRRDERFRRVPILVVSSEDDPNKRVAVDQAGANGWFPKPIDGVQILTAVQAVAMPSAVILPFTPPPAPPIRTVGQRWNTLRSTIGWR